MANVSPHLKKPKLRKRVLFFFVSVLLPALVLLFFTVRMNRQDHELKKRRAGEARQLKAAEIGRSLAGKLEETAEALRRLQGMDTGWIENVYEVFPGLVFAGRIRDGKLLLPWMDGRVGEEGSPSPRTEDLLRAAQRAEFSLNDLSRAESNLKKALSLETSPSQKALIRQDLARIYAKSGNKEAALGLYRETLDLPGDVADEYGNPFSLFAAERLSEEASERETVLRRIEDLLEEIRWLPAGALYLAGDTVARLEDKIDDERTETQISAVRETLGERLRSLKHLQPLEAYVASRMLNSSGRGLSRQSWIWESFGDIPWIVGIDADVESGEGRLLAFDGPGLLKRVMEETKLGGTFPGSCGIQAAADADQGTLLLEKPFRNLYLRFDDTEAGGWTGSSLPFPALYWLILILVVGFTVFGGWLVWRDVNRELAIADMRANFAATVSHELKTPLTAIRMFAEALAMGVRKKPESQQEYLQTIISESERLSRLLNNVLDFSMIEQGTRTYRFEPTSLEDVLRAAEKAMAFPLKQKGFKIDTDIEKGIPLIRGDRDALEQAVLNLLHNAMKYSGESREIELRMSRVDDTARIEVIDHGIGISQSDRSRIFGRYFRVPGLENQRIPGAGLGLAIVSHIVRAHGGHVEVSGRPGEGSAFTLILPLEVS